MQTYTINNDFHNTSVNVRCEGIEVQGEVEISPSLSQIKKMKKTLCGIEGCTCSGDDGARGHSYATDGKRVIVDLSSLYAKR